MSGLAVAGKNIERTADPGIVWPRDSVIDTILTQKK